MPDTQAFDITPDVAAWVAGIGPRTMATGSSMRAARSVSVFLIQRRHDAAYRPKLVITYTLPSAHLPSRAPYWGDSDPQSKIQMESPMPSTEHERLAARVAISKRP